jgi:hypothetical protein
VVPSGTRLLIEVSQWTWGTDSTWNTKYILLTPGEVGARELPFVAAIQRYFVPLCAWFDSLKGWLNETRIDVEVSPYKGVDDEDVADPTPSCVSTPTRFSFDVMSGDFAPQVIEVNGT